MVLAEMTEELVDRFIDNLVEFQHQCGVTIQRSDYYENGTRVFDAIKENLTEIVTDAIDEIKSEIKLEMRMEMHMELEQLKQQIADISCSIDTRCSPNTGAHGRGSHIRPNSYNQEIPKNQRREPSKLASMPLSSSFATAMDTNILPEFPEDNDLPVLSADDLLKNNPLFQRVETNLENIRTGKSLYKVEDFGRKVFVDDDVQAEYDEQREKLRAFSELHNSTLLSSAYEDKYRQKHGLSDETINDTLFTRTKQSENKYTQQRIENFFNGVGNTNQKPWYLEDEKGYESYHKLWSVAAANQNGLKNHGKDWIPIVDPLEDTEDNMQNTENNVNALADKYHNDHLPKWLDIQNPMEFPKESKYTALVDMADVEIANGSMYYKDGIIDTSVDCIKWTYGDSPKKTYSAKEEIQKRIDAGYAVTAEEIDQYEKIQAYTELCNSEYNQEDDDEDARFMELVLKKQNS